MNTGIDVVQIQRFGAFYIAAARLRSMAKWKSIIAAVDIGNPLFYLIAVGVGIGVLVEQGSGTSGTSGIKYIAFIAPALLANSAIAAVMDETVFPTIEGFKWRKLFFAQNATPITGRQIALGVYLSALCRAIASVSIYYILFAAVIIENHDQFFNILGRLVIMPMFLFSGTFFPLSSMPVYLQPIGWVSPLWHATELGREAAFDYGVSTLMMTVHITFLSVLVFIGLFLSMRQFERRLAK